MKTGIFGKVAGLDLCDGKVRVTVSSIQGEKYLATVIMPKTMASKFCLDNKVELKIYKRYK